MSEDFVASLGSAAAAFGVAAAIGILLDLLLYGILQSKAARKQWKAGAEVARSLRGLPTALGILAGVWAAARRLPFDEFQLRTIRVTATAVAILVVTAFVARVAGRLVRLYTEYEGARLPSSTIFVNLARGVVWVIGSLTVLSALGISVAPLIAALGVGGLAVGLALQPTLENVFAGIQILVSKQVQPGDFVRLESGQEGRVRDVTWRNTAIETVSNDVVIVPNATLGKSVITNFSTTSEEHHVILPVSVAYGSDLAQVERVARSVAEDVIGTAEGAVADFEPVVRFRDFADSGIELVVVVRAASYPDRYVVRDALLKALHARFAAEGIQIPFPQRVVHMVESPAEG